MMKSTPIPQLIKQEQQIMLDSEKRYTEYVQHAWAGHSLLHTFVKAGKADSFFFLIFLSQIRVNYLLAMLSASRRHHVQMYMNLRQVLEAGAIAAYAIGNHKTEDFAKITEIETMETPSELTVKRYKWLDEHYPTGSAQIKNLKAQIQNTAHANIIDAYRNFKVKKGITVSEIHTPFFDQRNDFQMKADFWVLGNVVMGLTDLFYGINNDYKVLTFSDDFMPKLKALEAENKRLKAEITKTKKFKRADARATKRHD